MDQFADDADRELLDFLAAIKMRGLDGNVVADECQAAIRFLRTEKRSCRFVLCCKDDSKGFMPLDITQDKNGDFYTIVSTMPHRAK